MEVAAAEALAVGGYALFLSATAGVLELLARYSHERTQRIHTTGFTYDRRFDHWICPTGQTLHRADAVWDQRVVRYRAHPNHCNSCSRKHLCTESDEGRTIEYAPDSWLQSGLRKFHRGVSLTLLLLAFVFLVIEILRQGGVARVILTAVALLIAGAGWRLARLNEVHIRETIV